MLVWKFCPHDLQLKLPTPIFLSILTLTEVSWLQKTHLKEVASASRFFLGPSRFAALRLPMSNAVCWLCGDCVVIVSWKEGCVCC